MNIDRSKGRSPYAAKNKTEHKYSDHYQRWASALPGSAEQARADRAFRLTWGVPLCWKAGKPVYTETPRAG